MSQSRATMQEYIYIAIGPGEMITFQRINGLFNCSCGFDSPDETAFRSHYHEKHLTKARAGILAKVSRTLRSVASVFSTPTAKATPTKLLSESDQSPSTRRRLNSMDTLILTTPRPPYTPTPRPFLFSRPTFDSRHQARRVSDSSDVQMQDDNLIGAPSTVSTPPLQDKLLSSAFNSYDASQPRPVSRQHSFSSLSSESSSIQDEVVHPSVLSSPNHQINIDMAQSHLRSLGLFVHEPTNILICVQCSSAIQTQNAFAHITKTASKCRSRNWRTIQASIVDNCLHASGAFKPINLPTRDESIPPLPFIPILDGRMCIVDRSLPCYRESFSSIRACDRHFQESHEQIKNRHEFYSRVKVQRIYNYRGKQRCVHVHVNLLTLQVDHPRYDMFLSALPNADPLPDSKAVSLTTQPTVFETIGHWNTALIGVDIKHLKTYSHPPYADAPKYDPLPKLIVQYITNTVAEKVKNGGHRQLLQQVHSTESTKLHRSPLRYPKMASTLASYAHIFSCYLTMLVRSVKQPIEGYPIHMTEKQMVLCLKLDSSFNDQSITELDLHELFQELSWELLSRHPVESTINEFNTPILRFLIAHHLAEDGDGNFKKATVLSHTLTAIQWCWQAIGYSECLRHAHEYPDNAFGAYRERVQPFLQEKEHTPFTTLRTTIHYNASIAYTETSLPRFVLSMDRTYFSIDGHPITFAKFKEYALDMVTLAESKLYTVLRGCDLDDIDASIKAALRPGDSQHVFLDRLQDSGAGYSFFSDTRNPLRTERNRLLKHFLRPGHDEFSTSIPGSTPPEMFKPVNCRLWLDEVDSLVSTVYAATIVTWPGAARGPELDHLTYRNEHGKRHIFMINNILTFVTSYIKTQQITGRAPLIPRGVDPRLARVLIITINFVYYAASAISTQLESHEQAVAYTRYVFVFRGKPMNAERMTVILKEHSKNVFHSEFGIRDWRHLMKFVLRHVADIILDPDEEETKDDDPLNSLFGHGGRIGEHTYAIESSTLSSVSAVDVTRIHRYGIQYQKALGFWPDLPATILSGHEGTLTNKASPFSLYEIIANTNVIIQDNNAPNPQAVMSIDANTRRQLNNMIEDGFNRMLPVIGDQLNSTAARALYNNLPLANPPYLPSSSAVNVHPSRLDAIDKLYNSKEFQSPQQAAMFEYILQNTHTIFGVLPTGGGKSLMFYGPTIVEKEGITVVISPFVALSDEQYETALELGIAVGRWPSRSTDISTIRLLVVSAHAAGTNEFVQFVRASVEHGLIRRIIFDEAHQILLSAEYRDCYDTLPLITRTGVVVHFLSATLLQCTIDEIIDVAGIPPESTYVIRASTVRPNIRYDVQHFSNDRNATAYNQMMDFVEELCAEHLPDLDDTGRMLVYCGSYKECDEIHKRTGYPIHRAKGSTGDEDEDDTKKRQAVAHDWRSGQAKVLIATTGFGNGIDYPHVRVVISVNPHNGSDAVQQTGRAGRDGRASHAYIIGSKPLLVSNIPDPDHAGVGIITMLYATNDCIRICLGEFDIESYSCVSHGKSKALLCARCQGLSYTKAMSLIPAYPGPMNYSIKQVKTRALETVHGTSRAIMNNKHTATRNAVSPIPIASTKPPRNAIYPPQSPITTDTIDVDHLVETPTSTSTRANAQAKYPTPASLACPTARHRESEQSTAMSLVNETPTTYAYTISTYNRKGKGRATETVKTAMLPPPLPPSPSTANAQRSFTVVDDVFCTSGQNRYNPIRSPSISSSSKGQPDGRSNKTIPLGVTQRRHLSLPPISPYRKPVSTPVASTPSRHNPVPLNTTQARITHPQHIELASPQLSGPSRVSPVPHFAMPQRGGRQAARSVTASRQQAASDRETTASIRKGYFAYIDRLFDIQATSCVICLLLGKPSTPCLRDLFMTCESGIFNPYRSWVQIDGGLKAGDQFNNFRTLIKFKPKQGVCYYCMRQTDIDAHPHTTTMNTCPEYTDLIKNFAWAVYCLPYACSKSPAEGSRWQEVLLGTFDPLPPTTRPEFQTWLSTTHDPKGLNITNLLLLCIRWTEMHDNHDWPPA